MNSTLGGDLKSDASWFENLRSRIRDPRSRNPDIKWESNHADQIECQMQQDKHRIWGFVIYRTTYDSADDWEEFLRRLKFRMEETFAFYHGRDILEKFQLTVIEDQAFLDGASTATIREHFQKWAVTTYREEQQKQPDDSVRDWVGIGRSARYRFAVQVDAAALHSIVHEAPAPPDPDTTKKGWVKLIDKSWYLGRSEGRYGTPTSFQPIEGVTEDDVGWMKVPYQDVMIQYYVSNRSPNGWGLNYRRPPQVVGYPYE